MSVLTPEEERLTAWVERRSELGGDLRLNWPQARDLAALVRRLVARVEECETALRGIEWGGRWGVRGRCPCCGWNEHSNGGHGPKCAIRRALSPARVPNAETVAAIREAEAMTPAPEAPAREAALERIRARSKMPGGVMALTPEFREPAKSVGAEADWQGKRLCSIHDLHMSRETQDCTCPTKAAPSTCDVPGCAIAGCHNPSQEELLAAPVTPGAVEDVIAGMFEVDGTDAPCGHAGCKECGPPEFWLKLTTEALNRLGPFDSEAEALEARRALADTKENGT